jgi:hypothetical protein
VPATASSVAVSSPSAAVSSASSSEVSRPSASGPAVTGTTTPTATEAAASDGTMMTLRADRASPPPEVRARSGYTPGARFCSGGEPASARATTVASPPETTGSIAALATGSTSTVASPDSQSPRALRSLIAVVARKSVAVRPATARSVPLDTVIEALRSAPGPTRPLAPGAMVSVSSPERAEGVGLGVAAEGTDASSKARAPANAGVPPTSSISSATTAAADVRTVDGRRHASARREAGVPAVGRVGVIPELLCDG